MGWLGVCFGLMLIGVATNADFSHPTGSFTHSLTHSLTHTLSHLFTCYINLLTNLLAHFLTLLLNYLLNYFWHSEVVAVGIRRIFERIFV